MKHRICSALIALVLAVSLIPAAAAAEAVKSSNISAQEYVNLRRWTVPAKSYLCENRWGGVTRVEYVNGAVTVEDYDARFALISSRTIQPELPIWGGFFAGENNYFLVFGQDNPEESDNREVIRVVKYDKNWNRLSCVSLYGANTTIPFYGGGLRCDEYGGYFYIRTCHQMYTSSDGSKHQANLTMAIRQSDMQITDSFYGVMNTNYGYISHSFNQFILVDQEGRIVALDHGDAYPRSIVLTRYYAKAGQDKFCIANYIPLGNGRYTIAYCEYTDVQVLAGSFGNNDTGAGVGGFAETVNGYVAAYQYDGTASSSGRDSRDIYLGFVSKNMSVKTSRLTTGENASLPQLVSTGLDGGYVLWTDLGNREKIYYAAYDANGNVGEVKTAAAALSDCAPICRNGKAVWYVTNNSTPVFYTLDAHGVSSYTPGVPTAYANTQTVDIDGKNVEFEVYALKDTDGNDTNYIKLRDLALALNGTAAQFEVKWDGAAVNIWDGKAYTIVGSEMSTPFSGNRSYKPNTSNTLINGAVEDFASLTLTDDSGNDYNYYQLRDLGKKLGFNVGWDNNRNMIYIETNKPFDPSN